MQITLKSDRTPCDRQFMTEKQALENAQKYLGKSAHTRYEPGKARPCRIGTIRHGFFDTLSCGDSWEDSLEHLQTVLDHLRRSPAP